MFLFTKTRGQRQYMSIIDQLLEGVFFFLFFGKICSKLYFYRVSLEISRPGTAEISQCRLIFPRQENIFLNRVC